MFVCILAKGKKDIQLLKSGKVPKKFDQKLQFYTFSIDILSRFSDIHLFFMKKLKFTCFLEDFEAKL